MIRNKLVAPVLPVLALTPIFASVLLLSALATTPVAAQVELGIDGGFGVTFFDELDGRDFDEELIELAIPAQAVRAGFFVSETVSIEPSISLVVQDLSTTVTALGIGGEIHYHFSPDPAVTRGFVAFGPFLNLLNTSTTYTQFGLAVQAGSKIPLGNRFGFRIAGGYARSFENSDDRQPSANTLLVTFGLSFLAI